MLAGLALEFLGTARRLHQLVGIKIIDALELTTHADRPAHRTNIECQRIGDFIEQRKALAPLAVDFVDEGDDRDAAQPADLEQLAGLRLDALGSIDHHDRAVDCGQCAVGIFGKILMPRRV